MGVPLRSRSNRQSSLALGQVVSVSEPWACHQYKDRVGNSQRFPNFLNSRTSPTPHFFSAQIKSYTESRYVQRDKTGNALHGSGLSRRQCGSMSFSTEHGSSGCLLSPPPSPVRHSDYSLSTGLWHIQSIQSGLYHFLAV